MSGLASQSIMDLNPDEGPAGGSSDITEAAEDISCAPVSSKIRLFEQKIQEVSDSIKASTPRSGSSGNSPQWKHAQHRTPTSGGSCSPNQSNKLDTGKETNESDVPSDGVNAHTATSSTGKSRHQEPMLNRIVSTGGSVTREKADAVVRQLKAALAKLSKGGESQQGMDTEAALRDAVRAVASCSSRCEPGAASPLVAAGAVPPLIKMLHSARGKLEEEAIAAISVLACGSVDDRKVIVDCGCIAELVKVFDSGSATVRKQVASALWNIASGVQENKNAIAESGAVPKLVSILGMDDCEGQEKAAGALAILASGGPEIRRVIISADAIPGLIPLLEESRQLEVQRRAAHAIWNISLNNQNVAAKAIPALVRLLRSSDDEVQKYSAGAVAVLAYHHQENKAGILAAGGLPALMRLVKVGRPDVADKASLAARHLN